MVAGTIAVASGALWWRFGPADEVAAAFPARGWAVIADFDNRTGATRRSIEQFRRACCSRCSSPCTSTCFRGNGMFDALRRMRRPDEARILELLALEICRRESAQLLPAGRSSRPETRHV